MQTNWAEKLQQIPLIQSAGLLAVKPLTQGLGNQSLLATTQQGKWVVRLNQPQLGVNRQLEAEILELMADSDITPKVIENNPEAGYLITEHLNQSTWSCDHFTIYEKIKNLQAKLKLLHRIPLNAPESRLDQRIAIYLQSFKVTPEAPVIEINQQLKRLSDLQFWSACEYLCHYDLNPLNLLGEQPRIIDWEFAGQGHALLDWLIMEHECDHDLSAFYPEDINPDWLQPLKKMIQNMMTLWQLNHST